MRIAWALRKLAKALLVRYLPMWSDQMDKGRKIVARLVKPTGQQRIRELRE